MTERKEITHDTEKQQFYTTGEERKSVLTYHRIGNSLDLTHTWVDPQDRGKGIAEQLVLAALKYAESNNLKIIPSCSYIRVYIERHREWETLLQ